MILVSVVTVVYNDANGLHKTATSLLQQSRQSFQWIIIDGGSTDETGTVITALSNENKFCHLLAISEKDEGIYDAMNKGIALANGRYCLFLNAGDCLATNNVLENLETPINTTLTLGEREQPVIYGNYIRCLPDNKTLFSRAKSADYIHHGLPSSHQAMLYPHAFLKSHRYDLSYHISGDYYITALAHSLGHPLLRTTITIAMFQTGGTASQNSRRVVIENARVQREVLRLSYYRIFRSGIRRIINILVVRAIYHKMPGTGLLVRLINQSSNKT